MAAADLPSPAGEISRQRSEIPLPSFIFYLFLALCAFLYLPTRFLHEANPIWRLTSLLWTLEVIGLTLLTVHLVHGQMTETRVQKPQVSCPSSMFHLPSWRALLFPVCFFLVAVPWPSGLEKLSTQSLMQFNTSATVELMGLFGIPAVQHGSVIEVSAGAVGIDKACSGIRSLQAMLMISLFLGGIYALSAWRRALCVVAGFALAFAFNLGRTLLLARVAAAKGVGALVAWHDPVGITISLGCFLGLWLIAWVLQKPMVHGQSSVGSGPVVLNPVSSGPVVSSPRGTVVSLSVVSWSLFAWLLVAETGTELYYQSHERATARSVEWSVHRPDQSSTYTEVEIPPGISGQLRYDEGVHLRWHDSRGNSWALYSFRWLPAHSLQKRVAIQLAKAHGPETCLPAIGIKEFDCLGTITVPVAGMELAMQHYVFMAERKSLQVFHGIYEDPTGSSILANRRKNFRSRVAAALAGSRNYGQRSLEVAVFGYERPEEARAALARELESLMRMNK